MSDEPKKVVLKAVTVKRPYSLYYVYILDDDCIVSMGTSLSKWGARRIRSKMMGFWRLFYYGAEDKIDYDRDVVFHETKSYNVVVGNA